MKEEFQAIKANSTWLIGDGLNINLWHDNWSGVIVAEHFQIPITTSSLYLQQVNEYINNKQWNFSVNMQINFPLITKLVQ